MHDDEHDVRLAFTKTELDRNRRTVPHRETIRHRRRVDRYSLEVKALNFLRVPSDAGQLEIDSLTAGAVLKSPKQHVVPRVASRLANPLHDAIQSLVRVRVCHSVVVCNLFQAEDVDATRDNEFREVARTLRGLLCGCRPACMRAKVLNVPGADFDLLLSRRCLGKEDHEEAQR